jgi:hypothetical protein
MEFINTTNKPKPKRNNANKTKQCKQLQKQRNTASTTNTKHYTNKPTIKQTTASKQHHWQAKQANNSISII